MSESFSARAARRSGFAHEVTTGAHSLLVDEPEDKGGGDAGPTPRQLLVAALASCVAITAEMYADRKGWDVGELEASASFEPGERGRGNTYRVELLVPGDLDADQLERLETIAAKCPVSRALEDAETRIEHAVTRA